jgi:hypothetical protein
MNEAHDLYMKIAALEKRVDRHDKNILNLYTMVATLIRLFELTELICDDEAESDEKGKQ